MPHRESRHYQSTDEIDRATRKLERRIQDLQQLHDTRKEDSRHDAVTVNATSSLRPTLMGTMEELQPLDHRTP
jgi:hypothetical protein